MSLSPKMARYLPWLIAVAFFMQSLDTTIVNVALPAMAYDLHRSPLQMQAVVISYVLTVAALIPISGWIADRFGTRLCFSVALALFTLGSLFCVISPTLTWLTISRIIQGIGGALMVPVGRLIILRAFPRTELVRVMSFVTTPALIGPLMGPMVGGWLVQYLSWHWIFLINLPFGLLSCYFAARYLPIFRQQDCHHFDISGFVLFSTATIFLSLTVETLNDYDFSVWRTAFMLLVGLGCFMAYWMHATRVPAPLFPLSLFRIRTFSVGILGNIFARLSNGALPFLIPLLLQVGLKFSPAKAGLAMIPMTLGAMLAKPIVRPLLIACGYRRTLVVNTLLLGLFTMSMALVSPNMPLWILLLLLSALGLVNSLQFTAMNTLTLIDLEGALASSGNSLLAIVMQLTIGMGVASSAVLLNLFNGGSVDATHSVLSAFAITFLIVGAFAFVASLIFFQLHAGDGRVVFRKPPLDEH